MRVKCCSASIIASQAPVPPPPVFHHCWPGGVELHNSEANKKTLTFLLRPSPILHQTQRLPTPPFAFMSLVNIVRPIPIPIPIPAPADRGSGMAFASASAVKLTSQCWSGLLMSKPESADAWYFVWDGRGSCWTWRRLNTAGEEIAASLYIFSSLNACIADAERAGFINTIANIRRVRASEMPGYTSERPSRTVAPERRRHPRNSNRMQ